MDERLNLTPIQVSLIHKIAKVNECRISHILGGNAVALVVRLVGDESCIVLSIARRGMINLLTIFPESLSALEVFKQMISIDGFSFASLLALSKEDTMPTEKDMIRFSTEQLFALLRIVLGELVKRKSVKDLVTDKTNRSKELLKTSYKKSLEEFRKEVSISLGELGLASEEDSFDGLGVSIGDRGEDNYFGLDESEIF